MAVYNKFQDFSEQQIIGTHDWDANVFKIMLTNIAPVSTNTIKANLTEITAGNGYTAGGTATTITVSETTGTTTVQGTQVAFTATGSVGPFQYAVLYNDTATNKNLIAWWDNGSAATLASGDTFTVKFNNTTPGTIFTLV